MSKLSKEERKKLLEAEEGEAFGEMMAALFVCALFLILVVSVVFQTFILVGAVLGMLGVVLVGLLIGWVGGSILEYRKARKALREFK